MNMNYESVYLKTNIRPMDHLPYGVRKIGASDEWNNSGTRGEYASCLIIDTGTPDHRDLKNIKSFDGIPDTDGHATHVGGTIGANGLILGVAPEVQLHFAYGMTGDWMNIADYAIKEDIDVVNISLGYSGRGHTHPAIKKMADHGIIIVASGGNSGKKGLYYPAKYPEVIAVAAVNVERDITDFSSIGKDNEVCAAGYEVQSTYLHNRYSYMSGTSMASPHIAGAVALLQSKAKMLHGKRLTLDEVRTILHHRAVDLGEIGRDTKYGYGMFSFSPSNFRPEKPIY